MKTLKNILICIILPITLFLTASITADDAQDTAVSAEVTSDTDVNTVTLPVSDTSAGTEAAGDTDVGSADTAAAAEMPGNLGLYLAQDFSPLAKNILPEVMPEMDKPISKEITLMAVGDNLMHMGIVASGKQADGSYDYSMLYADIADFLAAADIKVINQETILGGNERGFSGYPRFNSPTEVGDAIAAAGFNVVLHASNHSADQGIAGLLSCIAFWKTHPEVLMVGIFDDPSEAEEIPLLTIDGVTFAILNYTYGPNAEILPSSIEGHLNMLCAYDERTNVIDFTTLNPQVIADIEKADALADVVLVFPHWGTEYVTTPSSYQKEFARQMTEAGADIIIGTHPHVVEPIEWVEADNGNKALCYYSLGNYVSTQKDAISMLEGMAWVTFEATAGGVTIDEEKSGVIPLVCQYKSGPVRFDHIYLLEDYTQELADAHGIRGYGGVSLKADKLKEWSTEIFGDFVLPK